MIQEQDIVVFQGRGDERLALGQSISHPEIKKPAASYSRTGESRTTLGDGALNFRVRNGNGCDNSSMATGKKPFSWELKRLTTHNEMRGMISHHVKF